MNDIPEQSDDIFRNDQLDSVTVTCIVDEEDTTHHKGHFVLKAGNLQEISLWQKGHFCHPCLRSHPNVSVCIIDQPPLAASIELGLAMCADCRAPGRDCGQDGSYGKTSLDKADFLNVHILTLCYQLLGLNCSN